LSSEASVLHIADFAGLPVFPEATVRTLVIVCAPRSQETEIIRYLPPVPLEDFLTITDGKRIEQFAATRSVQLHPSSLRLEGWSLSGYQAQQLISRVQKEAVPLNAYIDGKPFFGIKTGLNKAFIIDRATRDELLARDPETAQIIKPLLAGRDVRRYSIHFKDRYLIWTYIGIPITKHPAVLQYLKQFQTKLEKRWDQGDFWWELRACDYYDRFEQPKIIYPDIATTCRFALDLDGFFSSNTTYFIPSDDMYLLGILNSQWSHFYFSETCAGLEGGGRTYLRFFGQYLEGFPVRTIDSDDPADVALHDRMVALVECMLDLHKKLAAATILADKTLYQRQIEATDRQIDALVYELYGLTEEEIAIVEGG
jgi:hypothetical protein